MEEMHADNVISINHQSQDGWAKLIRKLHWIGLSEQARRLEQAVSTLPPEERETVPRGPFSID